MLGLTIVILLATAQATVNPAILWQQANTFLEHQQYAEARAVLTRAVKLAPNDGAFWFYLGVSCSELQDTDAAIRAFEKARALSPKRAEVYFGLGVEYWRRSDIGKAKQAYQSGLALDPKEPRALQNYALLLMTTGEPEKAIAPLLVLKDVPELTLSARVSLIECYLKVRGRERAERETDELLREGLAGPEDETKLAAILVQERDTDAAERLLRASLGRQPNQANACAALGAVLADKKNYEEAAQFFHRAVELEPDSSEYAMAFAESLLVAKKGIVLQFLKDVEPKFGQMPEYQYKLALAYFEASKFPEAIPILEKLVRMNPPWQDQVYYVLGNSYFTTGKWEEAEKTYRKAIEINPKNPVYYEAFATLLRKQGSDQLDEAIAGLKRAAQLGGPDARVSLQLALCYESKGDVSNAVGLAEGAVRSRPQLLAAHVALARIYFRLGRKADADKEKKTVAELEDKKQQQEQLLMSPPGSLERIQGQHQE